MERKGIKQNDKEKEIELQFVTRVLADFIESSELSVIPTVHSPIDQSLKEAHPKNKYNLV